MNNFLMNYSSLTIAQVFNSFVILISYPFLVNKIGIETYGIIVVTQALSDFVMISTNFGFEISGLQSISKNRHNIISISKILTNIFIIKLFVFLIILLPFLYVGSYILEIKNFTFLLAFLFSGFFSAFIPYFFFQGLEKMNYILYLKLFLGTMYLLLIVSIIKSEIDYYKVSYIKLSVEFITFLLSFFLLKKHFYFKIIKSSFREMKLFFIESSSFFSSKLANIFNTKTPIFFTSIIFGPSATTILDFVIKLFSILQIPIDILASIIFPKTALKYNKSYVKKMMLYNFITASVIVLSINVFLEFILNLFLPEFEYSSVSFNILIYGFILVFNSINILLGTSVLVANGYGFHYNFSIFFSSFILILLLFYSYISDSIIFVYISLIISSFSLLLYRLIISFRYRIL